MTDLDSIIALNPIQPSTGPLSRQSGTGMPTQSLAGLTDPRQIATLMMENLEALQDQMQSFQKLLGLPPTVKTINLPILLVTNLTLTSNSLTAGNISWSACTVWYNGIPYGIAAGNTAAGESLVWWTVGATTFSFGNSFTVNATTFPIATNTAGTADLTWNKVGANSIQESQVLGGFLPPGYQIQTPATASVNASGTTTLLNYTGGGALLTACALTNSFKTAGGSTIQITVDGQPSQTINLTDGGGVGADPFSTQANAMAVDGGTVVANSTGIVLGFYSTFKTSILVTITVTSYTSGALTTGVGWAKKI
jgi:hypothetical protein